MSDKPVDVRDLPGIDFRDLRMCDGCGHPLTGKPGGIRHVGFYRVRLEHAIINVGAVQQFAGLAMMFGGDERMADVFAPERHAAKILGTPNTFLLCFDCMMKPANLLVLAEAQNDKAAAAPADAEGCP